MTYSALVLKETISCVFFSQNFKVGDTTIVKRGCGATTTCEYQKSHGHYFQFACNTCNTDHCNTDRGSSGAPSDSSGSSMFWWPLVVSSKGSGSGYGSSSKSSYGEFKQQALEYSKQARDIRQKLLEWEHEFDEWHHQIDHHQTRSPPPQIPSFC